MKVLELIDYRIDMLTKGIECLEREGTENSATDDMRARLDELLSLRATLVIKGIGGNAGSRRTNARA